MRPTSQPLNPYTRHIVYGLVAAMSLMTLLGGKYFLVDVTIAAGMWVLLLGCDYVVRHGPLIWAYHREVRRLYAQTDQVQLRADYRGVELDAAETATFEGIVRGLR